MKPVSLFALLALTVLLPTTATAVVDDAGTFTVLGIGNMSCAEWSKARENPPTDGPFIEWTHGYLTATNAYAPGPNNLTQAIGIDKATSWIDAYCSANPLDKVVEAAVRLVKALTTQPAQ